MRKRLIALIIIDIVIIAAWDIVVNTTDVPGMAAIGVLLILPVLILISGFIGLILHWQKNVWGDVLLVNMVIALLIYFAVWKYESWKQEHDNYKAYYFTVSAVDNILII